MAKFDLKGMLSERSAQEIDLPEQKTVYRNPEAQTVIPYNSATNPVFMRAPGTL